MPTRELRVVGRLGASTPSGIATRYLYSEGPLGRVRSGSVSFRLHKTGLQLTPAPRTTLHNRSLCSDRASLPSREIRRQCLDRRPAEVGRRVFDARPTCKPTKAVHCDGSGASSPARSLSANCPVPRRFRVSQGSSPSPLTSPMRLPLTNVNYPVF